jgi:hypothetical protein
VEGKWAGLVGRGESRKSPHILPKKVVVCWKPSVQGNCAGFGFTALSKPSLGSGCPEEIKLNCVNAAFEKLQTALFMTETLTFAPDLEIIFLF